MRSIDTFSSFHPLVNIIYFILTITFAMVFMHPIFLAQSIIFSAIYAIYLKKLTLKNLRYIIPLLIITAVINPAFNHEGTTILFYLRNSNPITLESIIFGIASAIILISVLNWFMCYNCVMTSDKFVYLFGRIIPAMSLVFSMTLRFIPLFKIQFFKIIQAQKSIGHGLSGHGSIIKKLKNCSDIISIMVSWSLENAAETAASMKSRGYGLKGRTAYSIYNIEKRDVLALMFELIFAAYIIAGTLLGGTYFRYFPSFKLDINLYAVTIFICYAFLIGMPLIINLTENIKWKILLK